MKDWLLWLVLAAGPVHAQRPTAEAARAPVSFWPLEARTGTVVFTAPTPTPCSFTKVSCEACTRAWGCGLPCG